MMTLAWRGDWHGDMELMHLRRRCPVLKTEEVVGWWLHKSGWEVWKKITTTLVCIPVRLKIDWLVECMTVEYSDFAHFAALSARLKNTSTTEEKTKVCLCIFTYSGQLQTLTWHSSSHVFALCTASVGTASCFVRWASAYSWRMSSSKWEQKIWDKNVHWLAHRLNASYWWND